MKFSISLLFVCSALFLFGCTDYEDQSARGSRRSTAGYSATTQGQVSSQQPFNPNAPPPETAPSAAHEETAASTPPPAPAKVAKGDFPYGIPVPGKPHLVESPFSPGKYIDVEGFAPGTEVKDPYTGKIFLVP